MGTKMRAAKQKCFTYKNETLSFIMSLLKKNFRYNEAIRTEPH